MQTAFRSGFRYEFYVKQTPQNYQRENRKSERKCVITKNIYTYTSNAGEYWSEHKLFILKFLIFTTKPRSKTKSSVFLFPNLWENLTKWWDRWQIDKSDQLCERCNLFAEYKSHLIAEWRVLFLIVPSTSIIYMQQN